MVDRISSTLVSTVAFVLTSISSLGHTSPALFGCGSTSSTEAVFFSAEHALTKTPTNAPVTTFAIILFRIIYPRYFSVVLM